MFVDCRPYEPACVELTPYSDFREKDDTMKKLLAGMLVGCLFSLGCGTDTSPKGGGAPSKGGATQKAPAPPMTKPGEMKDESKPNGAKPEDEAKPKDDSKKTEPKKDAK